MKVVAFNGSPRRKGNTYHAIQMVFKELKKGGIKTELIQLGGTQIKGCKACFACFRDLGRNMAWLLKKLYG